MKSIYLGSFQIHSNSQNLGYVIHQPIEGVGFPGMRMSRYARPGEHGSIVSNLLYDGRRILLAGTVFADSAATYESRRRSLQSALSVVRDTNAVSQPLVLKMTTLDDLAIQTNVYIEDFQMKAELPTAAEFLIDLYAPDPAFEAQSNSIETLARASGGGLVYPAIYPAVYGASTGGQAVINNAGSCEAFPVIYLNGPLTNPLIQNVTVERFIQLNLTLSASDQIVIDMKNKTIVKNGNQSVIGYKTTNSLFWWLDKGDNTVKFFTDSGTDTGNAQIHYRHAYLGV